MLPHKRLQKKQFEIDCVCVLSYFAHKPVERNAYCRRQISSKGKLEFIYIFNKRTFTEGFRSIYYYIFINLFFLLCIANFSVICHWSAGDFYMHLIGNHAVLPKYAKRILWEANRIALLVAHPSPRTTIGRPLPN